MAYWSILDKDNLVVGEWMGNSHIVTCYKTKKAAKEDAIKMGIPNYQIVKSEVALQQKQSKLSK